MVGGLEGVYPAGFWLTAFVVLISISLLSHILSPSSAPLCSPLLSERTLSTSGSVNAAEFHLNPRTWELWAKQEEQSDTPLPHPEQLLNLRNRIISAKVAALFYCQGHGKQTERRSGRGSRRRKTGSRALFASLTLTSVIAQIDLVMNFTVSAVIPSESLCSSF